MKALALSLVASLAILSSSAASSASAAVFRIGPVRVATRPAAPRPVRVARAVRRPAVRSVVHDRRSTAWGIIHDQRQQTWHMLHDALSP